jgi:hypothetical protein
MLDPNHYFFTQTIKCPWDKSRTMTRIVVGEAPNRQEFIKIAGSMGFAKVYYSRKIVFGSPQWERLDKAYPQIPVVYSPMGYMFWVSHYRLDPTLYNLLEC